MRFIGRVPPSSSRGPSRRARSPLRDASRLAPDRADRARRRRLRERLDPDRARRLSACESAASCGISVPYAVGRQRPSVVASRGWSRDSPSSLTRTRLHTSSAWSRRQWPSSKAAAKCPAGRSTFTRSRSGERVPAGNATVNGSVVQRRADSRPSSGTGSARDADVDVAGAQTFEQRRGLVRTASA